jgi:ABC-type antimicrobial peptide transport system permease subunit
MINQELIMVEVEKLVNQAKESLATVKRLAINEAWKILQVTTASVIQILEKTATDLSGPEKKELAMTLISGFYDKVFTVIDIPVIPNILEPVIHRYVKAFLMVLVSASIDAMVTTFRQVGVFIKKKIDQNPYDPTVVKVSYIS